MDPRLVSLLEAYFEAKEAGQLDRAAFIWANYINLIRLLGPSAIIAVRVAGTEAIIALSEAAVATMTVAATKRLATRAFIQRLLATLGAAAKPIPPPLMVGICLIGLFSSAKAGYAEANGISSEGAAYNLYLANYIKFISRSIKFHPKVIELAAPLTFSEWHEKKDMICLPTTY